MFRTFSRIPRILAFNLNQVASKQKLHVTAVSYIKKFKHKETELTYKFIQKYDPIIIGNEQKQNEFKLEASYSGKSNDELLEAFEALSFHCARTNSCISNDEYDGIAQQLILKAPTLTDDQLMKVLSDMERFPETDNTYSKNFHGLFTTLDYVCCQRVRDWSHPTLLKFCNLWMKLNLSKVGDFTGRALIKICRRIDRLPAKALVETMFYLSICRKAIVMSDVESRFFKVFDELDINEIGIMCLAFFKTETRVRTFELIARIYDKTAEKIDNIEDITIANILKTLRYSSDPQHAEKMKALSDLLVPKVSGCSLIACLHIGLLGTNLQICHQELMEAIVRRFNQDLPATRLKDIERITFALGLFDFKTESGIERELLWKTIDELKARVREIMMYPRCLAANAHYLTVCGVHDVDIIKSVLKEDFIKFAYGEEFLSFEVRQRSMPSGTKIFGPLTFAAAFNHQRSLADFKRKLFFQVKTS